MEIHNRLNLIDSRDIVERLEELEREYATLLEAAEDAQAATAEEAESEDELIAREMALVRALDDLEEFLEESGEELKSLRALAEEGQASPDWRYGEVLVRGSYFESFAQGLAEDIGAIDRDAPWPQGHIDWTSAAETLKQDYTPVDFGGVEYHIRA